MKNLIEKIIVIVVVAVLVMAISVFVIVPYFKIYALNDIVDQVKEMPGFENSTVVINAKYEGDNDFVLSENADVLIHPGSNYKLFVAAAAFHYLRPEFVFKTDFYVVEKNGKKNLLIKGCGDPTLRMDLIQEIAIDFKDKGIFIDGDLYYDDSYFNGEQYGPDWEEEWKNVYFAVPIAALQLSDNIIYLDGRGSSYNGNFEVQTAPIKNYGTIIDKRVLIDEEGDLGDISAMIVSDDSISIEGKTFGNEDFSTSANMKNPALETARVFRQEFSAFELMDENAKIVQKTLNDVDHDGLKKELVYEYRSNSLSEVVRRMLTFSKNNYGETLIRVMGEEINKNSSAKGSQAKGVELLKRFLVNEVGISVNDFVAMDGSGMSPSTRVTGRAIMQLFDYVNSQDWKKVYWAVLPTSNNEGTLHHRFSGLDMGNMVVAKTGTHYFASSLSGKIVGEGKPILFDIHIFDHSIPIGYTTTIVHPVIDTIVKLLSERL
jgi:D-alanyl-D-alanine carboxypeptidase/D-alanyl-D-alanine-endopeptidase (penicillin-binding protein 4)